MFSVAAMAPIDVVCSDKWNICVSYVFKFLLLHCDTMTLWHCDTMTLWHCDTMTLWHCNTVTLRQGTRSSQQSLVAPDYKRRHFLCLFLIGWGLNTARTASSNTCGGRWELVTEENCILTCLRPLWVRAEHSRYLTDRILFASFWPCSLLMGEWPLSARACRASLSSLRSILVPGKQKYF